MTNTVKKRKKKPPTKRKGKPAPTPRTLVPAVFFLLLTAALIGVLYLFTGKHLMLRTPAAGQKNPTLIKPHSDIHQKPKLKHKNLQQTPITLPEPQTTKLIIYRLSADFTQLITTAAKVDSNLTDKQKVQYVISLLTLPEKEGQAPLNQATRLRSVTFKDQIIAIDLSADIRKNLVNSGANDEILAVACLSNSLLKNFPRYNSVQILIDGKKCRTLAGHIDISRPLGYQTGIAVKTD